MKPGRIGPRPRSTPSDSRGARGEAQRLPEDLLKEASVRVSVMSMVGALLWILGTTVEHLASSAGQGSLPPSARLAVDIIAGLCATFSLGLFFYARRKNRDPEWVLHLSLVNLVLTSFGLALLSHWVMPPAGVFNFRQVSWIAVVLVMYAAIVPVQPWRFAVVGILAVSMNPIAMLIARHYGTWQFESVGTAFLMHVYDYLIVGVAVVIARVVTSLGLHVAKAREMGSYRLGDLLGRGGMGEVYAATHLLLARPAAIKLIRPEMLGAADDEATQLTVRRFRREAEVAASLRSPHTVELYDFGVTEDQTLYFVMEMLDGMDLESLVAQTGPLPVPRVIHVLRQVCASLEEAHARGLVHRDIKPANIHIGQLGLEYDFVKVLDFGLVKQFKGHSHDLTDGTAIGQTPGTPAYMAPEMALGEAVDGRADLYAVGCVAYFLLTGGPVFNALTGFELIAKHLRDAPEPLRERTTQPVPAALEAIVLRCLAKKPEDRIQTAGELSRALAAVDVDPWDAEQAKRWWHEFDLGPVRAAR